MSPPRRPSEPGLDDLLKALRAAGLPVAAREVMRLHRAFHLEPGLWQNREPFDQLRRMLAAALVHSPEERTIFEPIFRTWRERWERLRPHYPKPRPEPQPVLDSGSSPETSMPIRWRRIAAAVVTVMLAGVGAIYWSWPRSPQPVKPPQRSASSEEGGPTRTLPIADFQLLEREETSTPVGEATDEPRDFMLGPRSVLGWWLLLFAGGLGWHYHLRLTEKPKPLESPTLPGPRKVPYLPLPKRGFDLLDAEAARSMIWGVDRHVTEQLTPEINLDRTVEETARGGGVPELHFVPESRLREVWLWVDGAVEDPAFEHYAEEIADALREAGLPVRLAGFGGVPAELVWDEGQRFRPEELEGHRQSALVAILTDGDVLRRHLGDTRAGAARRLLASLATWERLSFVDCSGRGALARLLPPGLSCVEPDALPHVFGLGEASAVRRRTSDEAALHTWQATLALSPRPPTRAEAYALGRDLGLDVSPWDLPDAPEETIEPLRWLHDAERDIKDHGLASGSPFDRALEYWEQRLAEEEKQREERGSLEDWQHRPAHLYLQMERAFLKLWRPSSVDDAVAELKQLADADEHLAAEIRSRLGERAPANVDDENRIPLGWRPEQLAGRTREQLAELGFSAGRGRLVTPSRLGLAIALLVGLGGALVAPAIWDFEADPEPIATGDCPREVWRHEASGMRFVRVCAGRFQMGSEGDPQADDDEKPAHTVELSEFWIGELEVTNEKYRLGFPNHDEDKAEDLPAVNVSWNDARAFCRWLGDSEPTASYDLPSEAQWEYAARGSDGRRYPWGDDEPSDELAVFGRDFLSDSPEPTGQLPDGAGPFGTLDQAGNVWEWVHDCYDRDLYESRRGSVTVDPVMMDEAQCATSALRVLRGGAFDDVPWSLRSAVRFRAGPGDRGRNVGFRCVRSAQP